VLVTLLSAVFWAFGPLLGDAPGARTGTDLPASTLMFLVPGAAAVALTWRRGGRPAVRRLLTTATRRPRPRSRLWYVPTLLVMPVVVVASYAVVRGHGARWILGQCLCTVALRVVLSWIYANAGPGILVVALCQASSNVAWSLFPNHGSHFDPAVAGVLAALAAGAVVVGFGPRTLAGRRTS
jgi:hypothetical protein